MLVRLISLCIVLIIASQNLVSGHPSKHRSQSKKANIGINLPVEVNPSKPLCLYSNIAFYKADKSNLINCCNEPDPSCEMECCKQGRTTAASPIVRICCETV